MSSSQAPRQQRRASAALVLICAAALTACQAQRDDSLDPDMGNATPAASPAQPAHPTGSTVALPAGFDHVTDMETSGNGSIAVRSGERLAVGSVKQFRERTPAVIDVPGHCGDLTATADSFVLACGEEVWVLPADHPKDVDKKQLGDGERATVAAQLSSGELVTGDAEDGRLLVHTPGETTRSISVDEGTSQLVAVPATGQRDAVVRACNADTTVQDIDLDHDRQGGRLRVGLGLGQVSVGAEGILLASDTTGSQLAVYTTNDDVIRLHQTLPVDASPWAVAWDQHAHLAWVASTATNTATGYDISQGQPVRKAKVATLANATSMVALPDGSLVLASHSEPTLQITDKAAEKDSAAHK
ncbi:hypothetical protein ACUY3K_01835 [Corynebacterium uberis]|uniref:hypothetical protein n=1 Tax=Corynebacterium TaxID=1716 RepID=UPI001D0BD6B0|nr:hypothetical protein [Corynebacterium uberis]MCZ9308644.1 hypothetical protein [Corynebacterium sp. c6VSa_13]UDL74286.1 hypothetical protein LH391_03510 [Corynebacterium uberis]UDL76881.1 hypothetical protein LH393_05890 [Corynebacterium uberis]UDL79094.1 hypothetical protein LH394_05880 [Corynebacterium uberis]UDL79332.1 hypothetical protein LH392_06295 [Corynebacterium uberis]